jgi:peptidoglycan hydrolase CwlO-like protein
MNRKALIVAAVIVAILALDLSVVWAYECPARINEANEAIKKAEEALMNAKSEVKPELQALIDEAKNLVAEADAEHKSAATNRSARLHASSARKARMAVAIAQEAATLAARL